MSKFVVLQMSEKMLKLIPINKKGNRYNYGLPVSFELPEILIGGEFSKNIFNFAEFSNTCLKSMKLRKADIVICLDDGSAVSKEFEHFPAKKNILMSTARLEAETILPNGAQDYYISAFTHSDNVSADGKQKSMLYAAPADLINNIYKQFHRRGLKVIKIAPSISGLTIAGNVLLGNLPKTSQYRDKIIALVDLGFERVGLVLYKNGVAFFEKSFESVYDDIINLVCEARGISIEIANRQIRRDGISRVGGGNVAAQEQINLLMESSCGEVIRNMRVVLSLERLELDHIVFCGGFLSLANFDGFIESLRLDVSHMTISGFEGFGKYNISLLETAAGTGYHAGDFLSASGLILSEKNKAVNFLDELKSINSNKTSSIAVLAILTTLMLCTMAVQPILYFNAIKTNNDDIAFLTSQTFDNAKELKQRQADTNQKLVDARADADNLPFDKSKTLEVVKNVYSQIVSKSKSVQTFSIDGNSGLVSVSFVAHSLDSYLAIRESVIKNGYFSIAVPFTATANGNTAPTKTTNDKTDDETANQTTEKVTNKLTGAADKEKDDTYNCNVTLKVSDFEKYPADSEVDS